MVNIVTPTSNLFLSGCAENLIEKSDSLELRPEIFPNFPFESWASEISHIHFSRRDTDLNFDWSNETREFLRDVIENMQGSEFTVSFHLARDCERVETDELGRFKPISPVVKPDQMLKSIEQNRSWLRKQWPKLRVLIENNNFYDTGCYGTVTDPDFISRACSVSGSGLLFDWAHATVSAGNMVGLTIKEYVERLPIHLIRQVHLSSPAVSDGRGWWDAHRLPTTEARESCFDLLEIHGNDIPVTIEHYEDCEGLIAFLGELGAASTEWAQP